MKTILALLILAPLVRAVDSSAVTNSPAITNAVPVTAPPVKIRFQFKPILPK